MDHLTRIVFLLCSLFICLPDGMSHPGSAGTGTVMRPETLKEYAQQAGFRGAIAVARSPGEAARLHALAWQETGIESGWSRPKSPVVTVSGGDRTAGLRNLQSALDSAGMSHGHTRYASSRPQASRVAKRR